MAYVISDDCIACGTCIDECPVEAISEGDIYSINPKAVLSRFYHNSSCDSITFSYNVTKE